MEYDDTIKYETKNIRYILIGGVIIVWGIVIYRIINSITQNSNDMPETLIKKPVLVPIQKNDSFFLYANYPDPFIPEKDTLAIDITRSTTATALQNNQQSTITAARTPAKTDISFIKYHGMIANPSRKIKAALISINNNDFTLKEKESVEKLTLKINPS